MSKQEYIATRRAIVKISEELILDCFAIPEGTKIIAIARDMQWPNVWQFLFENDDFPETVEGTAYPELSPTVTADYEKGPNTWLTFDWGLKDAEE